MIPDSKPNSKKTSKSLSRTSSMSDGLTEDEDLEKVTNVFRHMLSSMVYSIK